MKYLNSIIASIDLPGTQYTGKTGSFCAAASTNDKRER